MHAMHVVTTRSSLGAVRLSSEYRNMQTSGRPLGCGTCNARLQGFLNLCFFIWLLGCEIMCASCDRMEAVAVHGTRHHAEGLPQDARANDSCRSVQEQQDFLCMESDFSSGNVFHRSSNPGQRRRILVGMPGIILPSWPRMAAVWMARPRLPAPPSVQ